MLYLANKTIPLLIYQPLPLVQVALLLMASQRVIVMVTQFPVQVMSTMTDKLIAAVSCLPNTTYDLPALCAPIIKSSKLVKVALLSRVSQRVIIVAM
jgi:hypothetical protein